MKCALKKYAETTAVEHKRTKNFLLKYKQSLTVQSLITCNLNRYECIKINSFLAAINTETKFCTCRFFNDKAMCRHLLLLMRF